MARNKRLHTELALIKLSFLQQAIELAHDNGSISKKKRLDGPVVLRTKPIVSLQPLPAPQALPQNGSRLFIHESAPAKTAETSTEKKETPKENTKKQTVIAGNGKVSLLDTLRNKYGDKYSIEEVREAEALTIAKLQQAWNDYATGMEQQSNKHSSVNTFKMAMLQVEADNFFTITVQAITQQKFIEQERTMLNDHIQRIFNNRSISFKILVHADENDTLPPSLTMNSRERFEAIAAQYPLVRELKDKLKLDIDIR